MAPRKQPELVTLPSLLATHNGRQHARLTLEADPETGNARGRRRVVDGTVLDHWRERGVISDADWVACETFASMYRRAGLPGNYARSAWQIRVDGGHGKSDALAAGDARDRAKVSAILLRIGEYARTAAALVIGEGHSLRELARHVSRQGRTCTTDEAKGLTLAAVGAIAAEIRAEGRPGPMVAVRHG